MPSIGETIVQELLDELHEQKKEAKAQIKWLDRKIAGLVEILRDKYGRTGIYIAKDLDDA